MVSYVSLSAALVKLSFRTAIAAFLLLFMCLPRLVRGAEMTATLDAITKMREAGIENANKPLTEIHTKYKLALQKYKEEAQKEGDLKGVLAATKAIEFQKSDALFSQLSQDPKIAIIQRTFQKAYEDMQEQVDPRLVAVDRDYAHQLEVLVKELTKTGSIEEAVKVSRIRDQFIEDYKASRATKTPIPANPIAGRNRMSDGLRAGEERDFEISKGVNVRMCWIPPGEFLMGSSDGELARRDDETQHRVTLAKGFWLGKYELTQEQWQAVMGNSPSHFKGKDRPVEKVSWNMITGSGGFLDKANTNATKGERFHLPTEAQWEYACRAGTLTSLNSGKDITTSNGDCRHLNEIAWYQANSERETHPVGSKKPNAWGLHDMHGNVWEWCKDWKGAYSTRAVTDPQGADSGSHRVLRGGGWDIHAIHCRVAHRGYGGLDDTISYFGFRLARSSAP